MEDEIKLVESENSEWRSFWVEGKPINALSPVKNDIVKEKPVSNFLEVPQNTINLQIHKILPILKVPDNFISVETLQIPK